MTWGIYIYIYTYICVYIYIYTHTHHTHIYIYTHNGILLSHLKKVWNIAICSNTDGPREYHTKWSKSDRERQILYDTPYMWNPKSNTNESIYKTETNSQT